MGNVAMSYFNPEIRVSYAPEKKTPDDLNNKNQKPNDK
jgi:hypothetical protein